MIAITSTSTSALLLGLMAILTCFPAAVRLEASAWVMIQSSSSSTPTPTPTAWSSRHAVIPSQTSRLHPASGSRSRFSSTKQRELYPSNAVAMEPLSMSMRSTTGSFSGDNESFVDTDCYTIEIRRCLYGDLNEAVDVIMKSYYVNMKNPWLQMYRLGELNRLQQNFPRMDVNLHCMFVAIATQSSNVNGEKRIIGFCDVDGRIPNQNTGYIYNPRPYVADMCVDPAFRRRGIGQQLIRACEDFSRNDIQKSQVYLRVERKNKAGIQLYTGMGYQQVDNDDDARGDYDDLTSKKIMLMCKQLESCNVVVQSNVRTKRDN